MRAHTYNTHSHHSLRKTTYTGPIIVTGLCLFTVNPPVNQTPALIVLDGFETPGPYSDPALVQAQALIQSYTVCIINLNRLTCVHVSCM